MWFWYLGGYKIDGLEHRHYTVIIASRSNHHKCKLNGLNSLFSLAWKIPWTEEPGRLQSMGSLRVGHTEQLPFHFSLSCIGEGNGNPLQYSCLENPRNRGAWWAAVYGVAQSRTLLKQLSSSNSLLKPSVFPKKSPGISRSTPQRF